MDDPGLFIPPTIITTHLRLSHINFMQNNDVVLLAGLYGDMETGDEPEIMIDTNFEVLNELLEGGNEDNYNTDLAVQRLFERLTSPTSEQEDLEFAYDGGISIGSFIFSLVPLAEPFEDDEPVEYDEDNLHYAIVGYTPRGNILPAFDDMIDEQLFQKDEHFNAVLAARYAVYLSLKKRFNERRSLEFSLLNDRIVFRIAEREYRKITGG